MGNDIEQAAANAPAPTGAVTGRLVIASFAARAGGSEPWIEESASVVKVEGGRQWLGRIGILAKAPPGGVTVHLTSSDPKNVPVVNQQIPHGADMLEFAFPPTAVGGFAQLATVTASLNGTSSSAKIQVLTPR